jgi:hypothetical protein
MTSSIVAKIITEFYKMGLLLIDIAHYLFKYSRVER